MYLLVPAGVIDLHPRFFFFRMIPSQAFHRPQTQSIKAQLRGIHMEHMGTLIQTDSSIRGTIRKSERNKHMDSPLQVEFPLGNMHK